MNLVGQLQWCHAELDQTQLVLNYCPAHCAKTFPTRSHCSDKRFQMIDKILIVKYLCFPSYGPNLFPSRSQSTHPRHTALILIRLMTLIVFCKTYLWRKVNSQISWLAYTFCKIFPVWVSNASWLLLYDYNLKRSTRYYIRLSVAVFDEEYLLNTLY